MLTTSETEALLVHRKTVHYLGVTIDNHLSWQPAVDDPRKDNRKILSAARSLLARGRGCTLALALRVYNAVASARVPYCAPVAFLSVCELAALDADHRNAVREYYALPHNSEVGPVTLAEAGETSSCLRITETALNHLWHLNNMVPGCHLLHRLHSLPHSSLGQQVREYMSIVPDMPCSCWPAILSYRPPPLVLHKILMGIKEKARTPLAAMSGSHYLRLLRSLGCHLSEGGWQSSGAEGSQATACREAIWMRPLAALGSFSRCYARERGSPASCKGHARPQHPRSARASRTSVVS
ncbi:hypothetical protein MRX96_029221 [Rhipicephalus microplus]